MEMIVLISCIVTTVSYYGGSVISMYMFNNAVRGLEDLSQIRQEGIILTWLNTSGAFCGCFTYFIVRGTCYAAVASSSFNHSHLKFVSKYPVADSAATYDLISTVTSATVLLICVVYWPTRLGPVYRAIQFFYGFSSIIVISSQSESFMSFAGDPRRSCFSLTTAETRFLRNIFTSLGYLMSGLIIAVFGYFPNTISIYNITCASILLASSFVTALRLLLDRNLG